MPVQIVIPVYRQLRATQSCVESVLASDLPESTGITLVNDASPEQAVSDYCRQAAGNDERITLLENSVNTGFVAAANRGFDSCPDRDVLLLNSDTEVAGDWLVRLRDCAYRDPDTATATPFSNNASICSYPVPFMSNELPAGWTFAEIDQLFRATNRGVAVDIPTAVGFCMFIRRACLDILKGFDLENFGHGYGEECDFSMRAREQGWKNVLAADVFVFHEGGASFMGESEGRKNAADDIMRRLHPGYDALVDEFINLDPLAPLRHAVNRERLRRRPEEAAVVHDEMARCNGALRERARAAALAKAKQELQVRSALEKCAWLDKDLEKQYEKCDWLEKERNKFYEQAQWLQNKREEQEQEYLSLQRRTEDAVGQLEQAVTRNNTLEGTIAELQSRIEETDRALAQSRQELQRIYRSRTWRYTNWLRSIKARLQKGSTPE